MGGFGWCRVGWEELIGWVVRWEVGRVVNGKEGWWDDF